ncbi:MAG TPA: hypothetical protein VGE27_06800, partial [Gemmatimonas sp.]|uniref:hypothetical protein n=1 Tax=Gemmatimonas sp. TaxID=1962908 RepID=UPI002ED89595
MIPLSPSVTRHCRLLTIGLLIMVSARAQAQASSKQSLRPFASDTELTQFLRAERQAQESA